VRESRTGAHRPAASRAASPRGRAGRARARSPVAPSPHARTSVVENTASPDPLASASPAPPRSPHRNADPKPIRSPATRTDGPDRACVDWRTDFEQVCPSRPHQVTFEDRPFLIRSRRGRIGRRWSRAPEWSFERGAEGHQLVEVRQLSDGS
jgi:hypothetical protein